MKVVDAGTNFAAPYGASVLADFGAEVIKVEPLRGDVVRELPPFVEGTSALFAAVNHDKRYLALDLRRAEGREVLHRLVADSDVLFQNLRPGREAKLGLDAASCHAVNPRLIHASVEAFYPVDGDRAGYDIMVQGESGFLDLTGEPGRPPARIPAAAIDHVTGMWLALGALAAADGPRERVVQRISMLDVALGLLNEKVSAYAATGVAPARMGSGTGNTTPHGAYRTADAYIVIGAATDVSFGRLAELLGPPLDGDERFATQEGRLANRVELAELIEAALASADAEAWIERIDAAGVPVGRVQTLPAAVARHRAESATGFRSGGGPFEVLAPPLRDDAGTPAPLTEPGPVGRDSRAILAELSYSGPQIDELVSSGTVGA
jgi:CoA:oxalate CoA-transferase